MEMVSVPKERYDRLIEQEELLQSLHDAGVNNWEGYESVVLSYLKSHESLGE